MSLKIQTPLLISSKTTDEPVAPSGFGEIFASGSKLYFRSDSGSRVTVSQNLTRSGSSFAVFEYTSSGFWIKPNNVSEIYVLCMAGGGGGGSGRVSAAGTASAGGGGSTGGSITARRLRATALTAVSYSITVGGGGSGGASQTTNSTNGLNGGNGSASSFAISGSTILVGSVGGNPGVGGTTTIGSAGTTLNPTAATPNVYPYAMGSINGASGRHDTAGGTGNTGFPGAGAQESGNASGAGGGGVSAANAASDGGFNGSVYVTTIAAISGAGLYRGTTASPDCPSSLTLGSNIKRDLLHFVSSRLTTFGVGLGGGAGAGATGSNAGSGSDGGNYGAGAGGGGGARNGFSSGPGGKGGDGLVYIVEYYY